MTAPRHVWIGLTGVWGDQAMPGVLLAWRQVRDGAWEAWVMWVPATAVRPVEAEPPTS